MLRHHTLQNSQEYPLWLAATRHIRLKILFHTGTAGGLRFTRDTLLCPGFCVSRPTAVAFTFPALGASLSHRSPHSGQMILDLLMCRWTNAGYCLSTETPLSGARRKRTWRHSLLVFRIVSFSLLSSSRHRTFRSRVRAMRPASRPSRHQLPVANGRCVKAAR